jgi:uncharacterized membrane protein
MNDTSESVQTSAGAPGSMPVVLPVRTSDILNILAAGLRDFRTAPLFSLAVGGIYTIGGWVLILLLLEFDLPYLVYPLTAGFALIAPFVAAAFYAISRSLERGETLTWGTLARSVRDAFSSDLGWMALVTGFSLFIWMDIAALLTFAFLGFTSLSAQELLELIFTTPMGLLFLVIGNAVGAVIALAVFSFSVESRVAMILWCATIAVLIALSLLSGLVALPVVLPILGHASWHLYRRAIASSGETA